MQKSIFHSILLITSIFIFLFISKPVHATVDPTKFPNNPIGIHIMDENDIDDAAKLVNSNGGDWGYVTIVIRADERKIDRWQSFFDSLRRKHLIPIVRIATTQVGGNWQKPDLSDLDSWIYFLNSLNWVTQNRYVVIGNEPNHATEWGGEVNPAEYAKYLSTFSKKLKDASPDFFVLPAGFDASAPNDKTHMSEEKFLSGMLSENANVINMVDGWTSHSYPNPNFSGSSGDTGQGTIRTYEWEQALLKKLGVSKELPIFITETGWAHQTDGEKTNFLTDNDISNQIDSAFKDAWNNPNIVAITPFILNYTGAPYNIFSWKKTDGSFYSFADKLEQLPKTKGAPKQIISGKILNILVPEVFKQNGVLTGIAYAENDGQTIWESNKYTNLEEGGKGFSVSPLANQSIEPNHKGLILIQGEGEGFDKDKLIPETSTASAEIKNKKSQNNVGYILSLFTKSLSVNWWNKLNNFVPSFNSKGVNSNSSYTSFQRKMMFVEDISSAYYLPVPRFVIMSAILPLI